jgi:hypothetical protein
MSTDTKSRFKGEIIYDKIIKFDASINVHNWVDAITSLRNNAYLFGLAAQSIKTEKKVVYRVPDFPQLEAEKMKEYLSSYKYEIFKNKLKNIMSQAKDYDNSINDAVTLLLSDRFMDDNVRADVMEHDLFRKVVTNQEPTSEECEKYAITSTIFSDYDDDVDSTITTSFNINSSAAAVDENAITLSPVKEDEIIIITSGIYQ